MMSRRIIDGRGSALAGRSGPSDSVCLARAIMVMGTLRAVSGIASWLTVRSQLAAERIVVPDDGSRFGGRRVTGPITAFAEANAIKRIASSATGGRMYGELPEDDPMAETAMDASLLRASLFTSVLAFGMSAAEVATGVALVAVGGALERLSAGPGRPAP